MVNRIVLCMCTNVIIYYHTVLWDAKESLVEEEQKESLQYVPTQCLDPNNNNNNQN